MEAVLGSWSHMSKLKAFCVDKEVPPFSKDVWAQIGRFARLVKKGQIVADLFVLASAYALEIKVNDLNMHALSSINDPTGAFKRSTSNNTSKQQNNPKDR